MKSFNIPVQISVRLFCLLALFCLPLIANSAVYKHVDDEGRLIKFSDQPQNPGDKPVKLPKPALEKDSESTPRKPASVINKPKRKEKKKETEEKKQVIAYSAVTILKPDNEEAIRANSGSVPIEVASQPELDARSGHRYVIIVDGEKHTQHSKKNFSLNNLDRGAHSISAEIHDQDGNVLVSSSSKTIYVLRAFRR